MKKLGKLIGVIALTAVIVFSMAACGGGGDDGGDTSALSGTWNKSDGCKFVFNGNSFTFTMSGNSIYSGTFSVSGSTITFKITDAPEKPTCKYQLSGSTLTLSNFSWDDGLVNGTYTKAGGSAGGGGGGGYSGPDTSDTFEMYSSESYAMPGYKIGYKYNFSNNSDFDVKVTINGTTKTMQPSGSCTFDLGQNGGSGSKITVTYSPANKVKYDKSYSIICFFENR